MDTATYKQQTSQPDAFYRDTLAQTIAVLERTHTDLALRVRTQLEQLPIPKPARHHGGPESDVFRIELRLDEVDAIIVELIAAEAGAVATVGTTTREASRLATLVDTWSRYRHQLHEARTAE